MGPLPVQVGAGGGDWRGAEFKSPSLRCFSPIDRNSQQSVIGIEESFIRARQDWNPEDSLSESQGPAPEKRGFQHNLVFFFWLPLACRVFPDQELNLWPMCWERRVLTTGPPGKSSVQVYVLSE